MALSTQCVIVKRRQIIILFTFTILFDNNNSGCIIKKYCNRAIETAFLTTMDNIGAEVGQKMRVRQLIKVRIEKLLIFSFSECNQGEAHGAGVLCRYVKQPNHPIVS